jgi:hypothetical protein
VHWLGVSKMDGSHAVTLPSTEPSIYLLSIGTAAHSGGSCIIELCSKKSGVDCMLAKLIGAVSSCCVALLSGT